MLLQALFLGFIVLSCAQTIVLKDSKLFVDGEEFFIKGIDYNPTPLGIEQMDAAGYGGGGYCSSREDPQGDFKSACYDVDYLDGSPDISGERLGPTSWFSALWQRDFPQIIAMGFNTVRLYGANPTTMAATLEYTNLFSNGQGKDHTEFMAYAVQSNLKVIFPLYGDYGDFQALPFAQYARFLRWQIDEVGNYSSLIMWQLGNELGYNGSLTHVGLYNDAAGMAKYNTYADYARRYTYSKWGRFIPITTAIVDYPLSFDSLTVQYHIDVLSVNVFRGVTFTNLFSGSNQAQGFNYSTCASGKPLFISEFGMQNYSKGVVNQIWQNVILNIDEGLIGAAYFEFIDEPVYNKSWGAFSVAVNYQNFDNSTTPDTFLADAIAPKQQFTDLSNGTYNGMPYNIPTDVYTLLGRPQVALASSTDTRCSGFATCPGSGTGVFPWCSGNGACNRVTGVCDCATGWSGSDCNTPSCPTGSNGNTCSGNGQCSSLVTPPECYCNSDYYGSDCSETVASAVSANECPNACTNGNGVCGFNYVCTCHDGWIGADCAVTTVNGAFTTSTSTTGSLTTSSNPTTGTTIGTIESGTVVGTSSGSVSVGTITVGVSTTSSQTSGTILIAPTILLAALAYLLVSLL